MNKCITIIRFFLWLLRHGILINPIWKFGKIMDKISCKWDFISVKEQDKVCRIFAGSRGKEYEDVFRACVKEKSVTSNKS